MTSRTNLLQSFVRQGKKFLYNVIPMPIQYKLGKEYREMCSFLKKSQKWDKEQLQRYQLERFKKIVIHAYQNVPAYKQLFDEYSIYPNEVNSLSDIKRLPLLDKETIRNNLRQFIAQNYPEDEIRYVTTGGSTGTPFGFYQQRGINEAIEKAFIHTMWGRVGYSNNAKSIVFRGNFVQDDKTGKYWKYDYTRNDLYFSSYHLTPRHISIFINKIKEFKPDFMKAYPSAAIILGNYLVENGIKDFPKLKAILAGSEHLYPYQREFLEQVFECRVFSWYGQSEKVVLAGNCEYSNYFHIFPEYGITEIVDSEGNEITEEGGVGEIVGTSLYNFVMPFIRYRTGDVAVVTNKTCECGRNGRLISQIEGRIQEYIVDKKGNLIPLALAIFSIHDKDWTKIRQIQFIQKRKGKLDILVVKNEEFSNDYIRNYVFMLFERKFEENFDFEIHVVDEIEKTKRGKHKYLIQKLPIDIRQLHNS